MRPGRGDRRILHVRDHGGGKYERLAAAIAQWASTQRPRGLLDVEFRHDDTCMLLVAGEPCTCRAEAMVTCLDTGRRWKWKYPDKLVKTYPGRTRS